MLIKILINAWQIYIRNAKRETYSDGDYSHDIKKNTKKCKSLVNEKEVNQIYHIIY